MINRTKAQLTALFATTALVALPLAANAAPRTDVRSAPIADRADDAHVARKGKKAKRNKKAKRSKAERRANKPKTQAEFDARMAERHAKATKKHAKRNARIAKLERHLLAKPGGQERIARLKNLEARRHDLRMTNMKRKRFGEEVAKADRQARKAEMKKVRGEFKSEMKNARQSAGLKGKKAKHANKAKRAKKQARKANKGKQARAERAQPQLNRVR